MLRSRPGDFSLSRGRPGDLSLRSSVLPSRYRCGVLGSRGWLGPSGGPGLDATRLVMCSLYVGGPLLLGLLSFKNNGREPLSNKNLTLHLLQKCNCPKRQQCSGEKHQTPLSQHGKSKDLLAAECLSHQPHQPSASDSRWLRLGNGADSSPLAHSSSTSPCTLLPAVCLFTHKLFISSRMLRAR